MKIVPVTNTNYAKFDCMKLHNFCNQLFHLQQSDIEVEGVTFGSDCMIYIILKESGDIVDVSQIGYEAELYKEYENYLNDYISRPYFEYQTKVKCLSFYQWILHNYHKITGYWEDVLHE